MVTVIEAGDPGHCWRAGRGAIISAYARPHTLRYRRGRSSSAVIQRYAPHDCPRLCSDMYRVQPRRSYFPEKYLYAISAARKAATYTSVSTYDRAVSLSVAHRLREILASLQGRIAIESGSTAEKATAKKELHSLQKANQQISCQS